MRNKDRIRPFLEEIAECWEKVPDWRFGQLMQNVFAESSTDVFFLEEDEMLKLFRKCFKQEEE